MRNQSIYMTVLILFAVSILISMIVYPEVYVSFNTGFILWSDYNLEYSLSFILTNFFYQGGIQLWDYFGQMPMTFVHATYGLFKFQNVVATLLYCALSPFSGDSAQLFHQAFAWGNLFSSLFLRLVGIFLLLNLVTKNRWIVMAGAIIGAVFFNQPAFLWGTFCFSLVPLGMYFVLRFFQGFQLRYLAALYLFLIVSAGNGVIHTGGALYFQIHFFILACLIWAMIFNRQGWRNFKEQFKEVEPFSFWRNIFLIVLVTIAIVGPYVYIVKFGLNDVAFDAQHSRISAMFSPEYYFKKMELSLADPRYFFKDTLNFQRTTNPTVYFGSMIFCLAAIGLAVSRNALKWVFGLAILLLWLLNHPRDTVNIGLIVHWINVLTNPLKTLLRSYFVSSYSLLAFLLIPLAALGVEKIVELCSGKDFERLRWNITGGIMVILAGTSVPLLPRACGVYVMVCTAVIVLGIAWLNFKDSRFSRIFFASAICLLMLTDVGVIIYFSKSLFSGDCARKPAVFDATSQSGSVGYEFANPKIFPFRQFFTTNFSFNDEVYLWFPRGISADFRHITNQTLNFLFINGHCPRHKTFETWVSDPEMRYYIEHNKRTIFVAAEAVKPSEGMLSRICSASLARDVIMVADPTGQLNLPNGWSSNIKPSDEEEIDYKHIKSTFGKVKNFHKQGDLVIFDIVLPADFPKHLSTTWFADDQRYSHLLLQRNENDWITANQVQGELVRPYTFDVQNIKEGKLTAAIPRADFIPGQQFVFFYPSDKNAGVLGLWKSQYDNLGIDYRAQRSGWAALQYPYDEKWKITVDGKTIKYYRVNKSFVGFPIAQGDHKILIQYWPDTSLRFWLLVSAVLTTVGLPVLIFFALRWGRDHFRSFDQVGTEVKHK